MHNKDNLQIGDKVVVVRGLEDGGRDWIYQHLGTSGSVTALYETYAQIQQDSNGRSIGFYFDDLKNTDGKNYYTDANGTRHAGQIIEVTYHFQLESGSVIIVEDATTLDRTTP